MSIFVMEIVSWYCTILLYALSIRCVDKTWAQIGMLTTYRNDNYFFVRMLLDHAFSKHLCINIYCKHNNNIYCKYFNISFMQDTLMCHSYLNERKFKRNQKRLSISFLNLAIEILVKNYSPSASLNRYPNVAIFYSGVLDIPLT